MPASAPDPDTPPAGKRRRFTWLRALALSFLFIVLTLAGLLLYDEPLQPYDDLEPPDIAAVPAAENGWDFLQEKWQALPEPDAAVRNKLTGLPSGSTPWNENDPDLAAAAAEAAVRITELREALAFPAWQMPERHVLQENNQNAAWIINGLRPLDARYLQLLQNHALPEAVALADLQIKLARTLLVNRPPMIPFLMGNALMKKWIGSIAWLLEVAGPEDDALVIAIQRELATDLLTPEILRVVAIGEAHLLRSSVLTASASDLKLSPLASRFLFKRHRTINEQSAILRRLLPLLWLPMDSSSESIHSIREDVMSRPKLSKLSGLNPVGSGLLESVYGSVYWFDSTTRITLALQRAMNVRIALHRWKFAHGTLPAGLTELVPDFLSAVPVDPFDGKPLRWDPTRFGGLIYSVGSKLKDDPDASFSDPSTPFRWVDYDVTNPAVRLELPSPHSP